MESVFNPTSFIQIDSDGGRIGPFWWLNADTEVLRLYGVDYVRWGSCGLGSHPDEVDLRAVDPEAHARLYRDSLDDELPELFQ
jgi:hypothetical protein